MDFWDTNYSAILWEEEGNQNQIIGVNVQAAQSLSMAISPHCVAQLSSSEALSQWISELGDKRWTFESLPAGAGSKSAACSRQLLLCGPHFLKTSTGLTCEVGWGGDRCAVYTFHNLIST